MKLLGKSLIVFIVFFIGVFKATAVEDKSIETGVSLFESGQLTEARAFFSKLIKRQPQNDQAQFYMGKISYRNRQFEAAEGYFDKSIELSPKNAPYYVWQGRNYIERVNEVSFFSKMSMGKNAKAAFEKAVELDPKNINGLSGLAKYYLGAPSIAGGDTNKAGELAQKIKALGDVRGNVIELQVRLNTDRKSVSTDDFKDVAKLVGDNRKHASFYNTYGYYLLKMDKIDEAIVQFVKQAELNPNSANVFDSLGDGYYQAKRYEEAADSFKKALLIDPDFSHAKKYLKKAQKKIKRQNR